ncbi:MAG TPA: hypothetical protein VFJ85_01935 [Acidimicrobiales bacterium]|nr:hypothetical protein [Acidimicrobiales bacterium]
MTMHDDARPEGARYEVDDDDGSWWELGWDAPLATFYAQHWGAPDDGGEPVSDWHGRIWAEHPDLDSLEEALGWVLPADVRADLEDDRAAWPPTQAVPA